MRFGTGPLIGGILTVWLSGLAAAAAPDDIAAIINRHIGRRLEEERVVPAPRADDAEYLRRAWLDLAGRVPPIGTVREFLEDPDPDKRRRAVAELLESSMYVERFAVQWRQLLVPEADSDSQLAYVSEELRSWLRQQALDNTPYDEFVMKLLNVSLRGRGGSGAMSYYSTAAEPRPTAFYAAKETAPENLAAATARLFLGVRVDCAQCHDHPFNGDWKQDDFWGFAAFFQGLSPGRGAVNLLSDLFSKGATTEVTIGIPDTDQTVRAKFLGGAVPELTGRRPRRAVAEWIATADNPYFSRTMVNRTWSQLLGRGLVDPVDDMDSANPPSHPELLKELSAAFAEDFDVRSLIEGITLSDPYQRASVRTHSTQEDPSLFARFPARRLDASQVHASLVQAFGLQRADYSVGLSFDFAEVEFRRYFSSSAGPLERTSSVQQVLLLMNGQLVQNGASPKSMTIRAWMDTPGMTDTDRIDAVYLSLLSRFPTDEERARIAAHLTNSDNLQQGLSDAIWSLVNSAEFVVNH